MVDRTRRRRRPLWVALAGFLIVGLVVTALSIDGRARPEVTFTNTFPTEQAAATAVLQALAARDQARLEALSVTEAEFRKAIWPYLPASAPDVGMPASYVWEDTSRRSRGELAQVLLEEGGRTLELEAVTFSGPARDYGPFRIYPEARLTVRDRDGERRVVRLFGSMVEADGAWKVYSYILD